MTRATLVALLAVHGPRTTAELARLAGLPRWWVRRRLIALWDEDLADVVRGDVWRLTASGHSWAAELREDEPRFARLTRTRS